MDLDVTDFFNGAAPMDYSASVAEIGRNAGPDTWSAACDDAADWNLLATEEQKDAFRHYAEGFGAWSPEEIASWDDCELNALCIQMVAGDMRDYCDSAEGWDWDAYEKGADRGTYSGRLYLGGNGRVYYCIGS